MTAEQPVRAARHRADARHQLTLMLVELLTLAHRRGDEDDARRLRTAVEELPNLTLVPLDADIAALAARFAVHPESLSATPSTSPPPGRRARPPSSPTIDDSPDVTRAWRS